MTTHTSTHCNTNATKLKTAALIPAAGSGTRLGKGPKAFLQLAGVSLLERCVYIMASQVDEIVVAISEDMRQEIKHKTPQLAQYANKIILVTGGASRQETVYNLVHASTADSVLIHDVARPFLSSDIVRKMLATLQHEPAASVVKPIADSLIRAESGATVDRDSLRAVQTPQGFQRRVILESHQHAKDDNYSATDDASLVRRYGYAVALVTGSSWLDKITTPADFERAQALAPVWDSYHSLYGTANTQGHALQR